MISLVAHGIDHALFDRRKVVCNSHGNSPALDFGAYAVTLDARVGAPDEGLDGAPDVTLFPRCCP